MLNKYFDYSYFESGKMSTKPPLYISRAGLNVQLQRQHCSRLERFSKQNKIDLFTKRARLKFTTVAL
jgi:hypothetical protein